MKFIYLIIGVLSLSLGCIGIVLPVLPTTPFLLLSLFCFTKSSKRFETWFINSNIYKKHLEDFVMNKRLPIKRKIILLIFATTMMMFPLIILDNLIIKILILCLMAYLYYYFLVVIKNN